MLHLPSLPTMPLHSTGAANLKTFPDASRTECSFKCKRLAASSTYALFGTYSKVLYIHKYLENKTFIDEMNLQKEILSYGLQKLLQSVIRLNQKKDTLDDQ